MVQSMLASRRQRPLPALLLCLLLAVGGCAPSERTHDAGATAVVAQVAGQKPIDALRDAFRQSYADAAALHRASIMAAGPVITQDHLSMTLFLPDGGEHRFTMDTTAYTLAAQTSHAPVTVYAIIARTGFGALDETQIQDLVAYHVLLDEAAVYFEDLGLSDEALARSLTIFETTRSFITRIVDAGETSKEAYLSYVTPLRPLIQQNLMVGAGEQLRQFREQMQVWRAAFPDENWDGLRVVILGLHQPRTDYALALFFRWLLNEPGYENRVVYAEFQESFFGSRREAAQQRGLDLMTRVDFDRELSALMFDDPTILQRDIMGPAAAEILKSWGPSPW